MISLSKVELIAVNVDVHRHNFLS